jgi:hypothetical protein
MLIVMNLLAESNRKRRQNFRIGLAPTAMDVCIKNSIKYPLVRSSRFIKWNMVISLG